jgi:protein tyrosine/serine phosphatase
LRLLLAFVAVAVALGIAIWWWIETGRFYTVHAGHLYRSAALPPQELVEVCRRYAIRAVIDLRDTDPEAVQQEANALSRAGIRHVHLPSKQTPPPERVTEFLKVMDDQTNHPALVHCTHGVGRSGLFAAVYRIEYQGWSNAAALREARFLSGFQSFRAGDGGKGDFLLRYVPRSRRNP